MKALNGHVEHSPAPLLISLSLSTFVAHVGIGVTINAATIEAAPGGVSRCRILALI